VSGNLPRFLYPWWLVVLVWLAAGCAPKIGDHCSISTDCSANGDRLCDTTQPAGYCTVFNCEPNGCPEEAVCVSFNEKSCPDLGNGQATSQQVRFQRTFCMATCFNDGDCRGGYTCLDTVSDPARKVLDTNPVSRRVCTVPPAVTLPEAAPPPDAPPPAVCSPSDASFSTSDAGTDGPPDVSTEAAPDGSEDAAPDGADDTAPDGTDDGAPDGTDDAVPDGADDDAAAVDAGD
jgi:hypothetical protein